MTCGQAPQSAAATDNRARDRRRVRKRGTVAAAGRTIGQLKGSRRRDGDAEGCSECRVAGIELWTDGLNASGAGRQLHLSLSLSFASGVESSRSVQRAETYRLVSPARCPSAAAAAGRCAAVVSSSS